MTEPTDPTVAIQLVRQLNTEIAKLRAENWHVTFHGGYEDVPVCMDLHHQAAGLPEHHP